MEGRGLGMNKPADEIEETTNYYVDYILKED